MVQRLNEEWYKLLMVNMFFLGGGGIKFLPVSYPFFA